eukprot:403357182
MQQTYTKKLESAKDMERPLSIENVIKKFPNFRFTEKKKIGEGSYGIVSKAYDTQEKRWVALKKIKMVKEDLNDGLPHTFMREVTILSTIGKHENVIGILDIFFEDNSFIIAMEYADKGDLQKFLYQQKGYLSFASVRSILTQILEGVNFMHSKGLIHRDLKTSNILITAKGRVMIADFGLSKYARMPHVEQTLAIQSLWYRPPEILLGSTFYTFSVDYWSIGIIAHELIHKITPYGGTSEIDMLIKIFGHRGTPKFNELEDFQISKIKAWLDFSSKEQRCGSRRSLSYNIDTYQY